MSQGQQVPVQAEDRRVASFVMVILPIALLVCGMCTFVSSHGELKWLDSDGEPLSIPDVDMDKAVDYIAEYSTALKASAAGQHKFLVLHVGGTTYRADMYPDPMKVFGMEIPPIFNQHKVSVKMRKFTGDACFDKDMDMSNCKIWNGNDRCNTAKQFLMWNYSKPTLQDVADESADNFVDKYYSLLYFNCQTYAKTILMDWTTCKDETQVDSAYWWTLILQRLMYFNVLAIVFFPIARTILRIYLLNLYNVYPQRMTSEQVANVAVTALNLAANEDPHHHAAHDHSHADGSHHALVEGEAWRADDHSHTAGSDFDMNESCTTLLIVFGTLWAFCKGFNPLDDLVGGIIAGSYGNENLGGVLVASAIWCILFVCNVLCMVPVGYLYGWQFGRGRGRFLLGKECIKVKRQSAQTAR